MKRILSLMTAVLLCINIMSGCNVSKTKDNTTEITLYYTNSQQNNLVEENRSVVLKDNEKPEVRLMRELLAGPKLPNSTAVIPKDTRLLNIDVQNGHATVNLSSDYYDFDNTQNKDALELLARYSVVSTLCTLPNINRVTILIDGSPLINSAGKIVGEISINDIISGDNAESSKAQKFITLYFAGKNGKNLVMERRRVDISDISLETAVVTELIKGSNSEGAVNLIPQDTKVLSVETKEGICFVNLSSDFIKKYTGGTAGGQLCIYSIVNSLTELEGIEKVQFLIEGAKTDLFNEMVFSEVFERDETLIQG